MIITKKIKYSVQRAFPVAVPLLEKYYSIIYRLWLHGFSNIPITVDIETNNFCNRKCWYCPRTKDIPKKEELELKYIKKIIDQLAQWGFRGRVTPSMYNEPLLDKRLKEIIEYTKEKLPKAKFDIFTNGDLLTENVVLELKAAGVHEFLVALHEPSDKELVKRLFDLEKNYSYVLVKDMRDSHRKIKLFNRAGYIKLKDTKPIYYCRRIDYMSIMANGDIVLCHNDFYHKHVFGNVKTDSIIKAWTNPYFTSIRKKIKKGESEFAMCKACTVEVD